MKILIYSPLFYPSIGGLQNVVSVLASEFVRQGHEVKVVCQVPDPEAKVFPFEVLRQIGPQQLLKLTIWCDVYFQVHWSLKGIWPLLLVRRPLVLSHQGFYRRADDSWIWQDRLKHFATRFATNISASQAVADSLPTRSTVIPNPYQDDIFGEIPDIDRDRDLIFLGRLVPEKGADLLLEALANLKRLGLTPRLTVVGSGTEESNLRQQAKNLNIVDRVDFVGVKRERELVELLNAHKILVIPSRWQEPFGIVALEGIACGCLAIGSEEGGLKDAIGPCGVTFPNENVEALTQAIFDFLTAAEKIHFFTASAPEHLSRHTRAAVAKAYLQVIERVV
ncbi:MAG: glycosyltransferase family 4 protein [Cyanosarcina radialis HA8281-LM2]|jgi:glycosyltransferase involved in cell wall biosynthesis|nr:glycosyltransferase family 4 protein [Cyanosarcina radialis HA8281-LM2]